MFRASKCVSSGIFTRMISSKSSEGLEALSYERANWLASALQCSPSYALQIIHRNPTSFLVKDWDHKEKTLTFLKENLPPADIAKIRTRILSAKKSTERLSNERANWLACALQCSPSYALQIFEKSPYLFKDWDHVEKTLTFLKGNLPLADIAENYQVLRLRRKTVEQRYAILQEIGFTNITAKDIKSRYSSIQSSTLSELQLTKHIPTEWDPLDGMLAQLQCDENLSNIIREKLCLQNHRTKMSIKCIRFNILVNYLSRRLDMLPEEVSSQLNKHKSVGAKSFKELQATLNFIFNEFKFSLELVRRHFYILRCNPENLQNVLNSSTLAEVDIKKIFLSCPTMATRLCLNLEKVVEILHSFEISEQQIHRYKKILTYSPELINQRLHAMQKVPEFWCMRSCDRFLCLLSNYKFAQRQLEDFKQAGHVAISLNMLINHNLISIVTGNDRCLGKECFAYFARFFDKSYAEVHKKICHPYKYRISLLNSQKILEEFMSRGFSKTQLWNSLFIVLYDYGVIVQYFDGLKDRPELRPFETWRNQPLVLDLVVYYIERELRFSGAGVFYTTSQGKDAGTICDMNDVAENNDSECLENTSNVSL